MFKRVRSLSSGMQSNDQPLSTGNLIHLFESKCALSVRFYIAVSSSEVSATESNHLWMIFEERPVRKVDFPLIFTITLDLQVRSQCAPA